MRLLVSLCAFVLIGQSCQSPNIAETDAQISVDKAEGVVTAPINRDPVPRGIYEVCEVGPVPQALRLPPYNLDEFYQKHCDMRGIPVLGSAIVRDEALVAAHQRVFHMSRNDTHRTAMINNGLRVAIMAQSEVTTDIPEHSDLNEAFPETDWDQYRGLGATLARPAVSGAEENLLGLAGDVYQGEDIFVHEFSHALHQMGISPVDSSFDIALGAAYDAAVIAGLWENTYAQSNVNEYWAETVQSWYDRNQTVASTDGVHNEIDTRAELESYDPEIAVLIQAYLPSSDFPVDVY